MFYWPIALATTGNVIHSGMPLRPALILIALAIAAPGGASWDSPARKRRAAAPPSTHKPRTKSHRSRGLKTRAASPAKAAPTKLLAPGRWRPDVAEAVEQAMAAKGRDTEEYSSADPPVAAFAYEDVAVTGSIAESLFYRLVSRAEFKFSETFWAQVPAQYGAARIRAAYDNFRTQPRSAWPNDPYYRIYRKGFFRCQESVCLHWGAKRCAEWRVRLLVGFPEVELRPYIKATLEEEFQRPVGQETVEEFSGDPSPVRVRVGLRRITEMEDLFFRLKDRGFDVWVLSDAYQWAAEEFAKEYGVHPTRVLAIRAKVSDGGVLTEETLIPVPKGAGRAEAVAMFIGRPPVLACGDIGDLSLLDYGRGLRVLFVEQKDADSPPPRGRKWLIQSRFSPERAPQETGHPVLPMSGGEGGEAAVGQPE